MATERSTEGVSAWDYQPTRDAVRRYRRAGRLWLVVGALLLVGAVAIVDQWEERSEVLARTGRRAAGVVVDVDRGIPFPDGRIDVRFEADGGVHLKQINLDSDSPEYEVGDQVEVIYDPENPSNLMTTEEHNASGWSAFGFVVGVVGGLVAMPAGWTIRRRAQRWTRMLQAAPWRQVESTYKETPAGPTIQALLRLRDGSDGVVGGVTSVVRWRLGALRGLREVWIVGDLHGPVIVAPSRGGPLFEVRPARRGRKQRKWETEFGADSME